VDQTARQYVWPVTELVDGNLDTLARRLADFILVIHHAADGFDRNAGKIGHVPQSGRQVVIGFMIKLFLGRDAGHVSLVLL
jgi:hypothetical protein